MAFICPSCKAPSLESLLGMEFPPDGQSDEVTLQLLACKACGFLGASVYEESRRGSLDHESFHHFGWALSRDDHDTLRAAMMSCKKPNDARCTCKAHKLLGRTNDSNYWDGLRQNGIALGDSFRIELGPT